MKKITTEDLNLYYGSFHALKGIGMAIEERRITAIIGPSGCGKSTLVRIFNRINDLIEEVRITGKVLIDGRNIYEPDYDLVSLRKSVGMVFQRPNPFPLSIYDNVAFGPRIHRMAGEGDLPGLVEESLKAVNLWGDLKDKLKRSALNIPLEQQQRLCIARLIAVRPDVLLMDEPCSALDPVATLKIEELMTELKKRYTIVIVTHNMQQAARISDETGFMLLGELIEFDRTEKIFTAPSDKRTEEYITGRYG
ncbi:MAG TPA: phosphate ABC transporter ATP-binding protein PstB [bacterium]|nr:phosphate ABC transporter ATP-binding protein PstB [bacterium]